MRFGSLNETGREHNGLRVFTGTCTAGGVADSTLREQLVVVVVVVVTRYYATCRHECLQCDFI